MGRHLEMIAVMQVKEVAKQLKCSPALVYNLCAQGMLAHHRLGVGRGTIRISQADLDNFLSESHVTTANLMVPAALKHLRLPKSGGR